MPDPETPATPTILLSGMSTSTFLRLCTRAPRTSILLTIVLCSVFWKDVLNHTSDAPPKRPAFATEDGPFPIGQAERINVDVSPLRPSRRVRQK